jgi:transposase
MTYVSFNIKQRAALESVISNSRDPRQVLRAYALLWLDDGDSVEEVAHRLDVCRQSVYNWAARFQQREELTLRARLADAARSGRPCTAKGIIDPLIDAVIDTDPRQLGYRSTVWTAPLMVTYLRDHHQLPVSADSVSLAIARLAIRWKRPRHSLALRPHTWRQSKGG